MNVTKEEFMRAFERNNQFIQNEKRRNLERINRNKAYDINDFKIERIQREKRKYN